ncbi:MAG: tyrosine-type recombinase/integrase [Pseudomonadota bacterium]
MRETPRKPKNVDRRGREYLTPAEIDGPVTAAGKLGRHGLRVSELVAFRWDQVDLDNALLHVRRRKNGIPSTQPLHGPELRAQSADDGLDVSQNRGPRRRGGRDRYAGSPAHLRHSTGFKLANDGHDTRAIQHYLGYKNIQHTVGYTQLAADRFKGFWDD